MKDIYVISDFIFSNKTEAEELGMTIDKYNKMIIDKWNSCVQEKDLVYIFGKFGGDIRKETREIISKLKGKLYIVNSSDNNRFTIDEWKSWGINMVWDSSFYFNTKNMTIYFLNSKKKGVVGKDIYNAVTYRENLDMIYKNKKISIEAKYWDYTPILLDELPEIILRLKDFEEMESEIWNG